MAPFHHKETQNSLKVWACSDEFFGQTDRIKVSLREADRLVEGRCNKLYCTRREGTEFIAFIAKFTRRHK